MATSSSANEQLEKITLILSTPTPSVMQEIKKDPQSQTLTSVDVIREIQSPADKTQSLLVSDGPLYMENTSTENYLKSCLHNDGASTETRKVSFASALVDYFEYAVSLSSSCPSTQPLDDSGDIISSDDENDRRDIIDSTDEISDNFEHSEEKKCRGETSLDGAVVVQLELNKECGLHSNEQVNSECMESKSNESSESLIRSFPVDKTSSPIGDSRVLQFNESVAISVTATEDFARADEFKKCSLDLTDDCQNKIKPSSDIGSPIISAQSIVTSIVQEILDLIVSDQITSHQDDIHLQEHYKCYSPSRDCEDNIPCAQEPPEEVSEKSEMDEGASHECFVFPVDSVEIELKLNASTKFNIEDHGNIQTPQNELRTQDSDEREETNQIGPENCSSPTIVLGTNTAEEYVESTAEKEVVGDTKEAPPPAMVECSKKEERNGDENTTNENISKTVNNVKSAFSSSHDDLFVEDRVDETPEEMYVAREVGGILCHLKEINTVTATENEDREFEKNLKGIGCGNNVQVETRTEKASELMVEQTLNCQTVPAPVINTSAEGVIKIGNSAELEAKQDGQNTTAECDKVDGVSQDEIVEYTGNKGSQQEYSIQENDPETNTAEGNEERESERSPTVFDCGDIVLVETRAGRHTALAVKEKVNDEVVPVTTLANSPAVGIAGAVQINDSTKRAVKQEGQEVTIAPNHNDEDAGEMTKLSQEDHVPEMGLPEDNSDKENKPEDESKQGNTSFNSETYGCHSIKHCVVENMDMIENVLCDSPQNCSEKQHAPVVVDLPHETALITECSNQDQKETSHEEERTNEGDQGENGFSLEEYISHLTEIYIKEDLNNEHQSTPGDIPVEETTPTSPELFVDSPEQEPIAMTLAEQYKVKTFCHTDNLLLERKHSDILHDGSRSQIVILHDQEVKAKEETCKIKGQKSVVSFSMEVCSKGVSDVPGSVIVKETAISLSPIIEQSSQEVMVDDDTNHREDVSDCKFDGVPDIEDMCDEKNSELNEDSLHEVVKSSAVAEVRKSMDDIEDLMENLSQKLDLNPKCEAEEANGKHQCKNKLDKLSDNPPDIQRVEDEFPPSLSDAVVDPEDNQESDYTVPQWQNMKNFPQKETQHQTSPVKSLKRRVSSEFAFQEVPEKVAKSSETTQRDQITTERILKRTYEERNCLMKEIESGGLVSAEKCQRIDGNADEASGAPCQSVEDQAVPEENSGRRYPCKPALDSHLSVDDSVSLYAEARSNCEGDQSLPQHHCRSFNRSYAPSVDFDSSTVIEQTKIDDIDSKVAIRVQPLYACKKPIRLGLSKRRKLRPLHPNFRPL